MSREIVVFRFSSLGDVAMLVPVFLSFHAVYPDYKILLLSRERFRPIFLDLEFVNFIPIDDNKGDISLLKITRLIIQLSFRKAVKIIDLHNVLRTQWLGLICRVLGQKTYKIDKGRAEKKALIAKKGKDLCALKSTFERYQEVFLDAGFSFPLQQNPQIKTKKQTEVKWIGIAPFAKHTSKEISLNWVIDFINLFSSIPNIKFIILGNGEQEEEKANFIIQNTTQTTSWINQFNFQEELNKIKELDLMISMDSGNGHLAAMYHLPVITLWGTTHPFLGFAPYGQPIENSFFPDSKLYPELPISVYGICDRIEYERAVDSISKEMVYERVNQILDL